MYPDSSGDISCDSSSGYDGQRGSMNCWDLEIWTKSDIRYYCINDGLDLSWEVKFRDICDILQICNCWEKLGFEVYVVTFSLWRKGYDYHVYSIKDIVKEDLVSLEDNYLRAYVKKI
jgi:hypothetical protein